MAREMSNSCVDLLEKSKFWEKEAVDRPGWLPEGWTMEIKTRKSGMTAGVKDRYYRDPVTGCKLRSKDEVLRYLTGKPTNSASQSVKRCIDMCTKKYLLTMENSAEWLPKGWITEIRTRMHGARAGDKYRCYVDPSNGCKFYSKKDVLCYLENGIIRRRVNKQKRSVNTLSIDRPIAIKRQKLPSTTAMRCLFGSQNLNSDGTAPELIGEFNLEVKCLQLTIPDLNQRGENTELGSLSLQNTELQNKMEGNSVQAKLLQNQSLEWEDRKLPKNKVLFEFENKRQLEDGVPLELKYKKPLENGLPLEMENSEDRKLPENGMLLQFENKKKLEDGVPMEPEVKNPSENGVLPELEDKPSLKNGLEKQKTGRVHLQSSKPRAKKRTLLPCRASKRLAELKAKMVPDLVNQPSGTDPANTPSASDVVENNHNGNPSLGDPIGNPENEKALHKDPEAPLVFPFGDSWPDPSLEFAFKMLTGVIPEVEDISIEDYLQPQLGVPHTQSPEVADGLLQNDLFHAGNDSLPRFMDDKLKSNGKERAGNAGRER